VPAGSAIPPGVGSASVGGAATSSGGAGATGSSTVKRDPFPSVLSTTMSPPCKSTT
jgi:hypothetical protein